MIPALQSYRQANPAQRRDTTRIMTRVCWALVPGTALMALWFGPGVVTNGLLLILLCVLFEAGALLLRQRSIRHGLNDGSIVLAAWLLALCLPPAVPMFVLVIGAAATTLLGKHVYGGLGQNPFNPAMVGYAVLLISFPQNTTQWIEPQWLGGWFNPDTWERVWSQITASSGVTSAWDAVTQATPLDQFRTATHAASSATTSASGMSGMSGVSGVNGSNTGIGIGSATSIAWISLSAAWLAGGLYLLFVGVIRWHLPVAMLAAATTTYIVYTVWMPDITLPLPWVLFYGGLIFGAFFIATDPVTAPSSRSARLWYGAGIGVLCVVLRVHSNYPEGVAFAVLLMNACAPLLDRVCVRDQPQ